MTCIVGIEHSGRVLIGADSAGIAGLSKRIRADQKVFAKGQFAFGFTSSFRMGQLLRYKLVPPPFIEGLELEEFMSTVFVDAVRQVLKDGGYTETVNGRESGGLFLVGVRGALFRIDDDFQVGRSVEGYEAVGCGDDLAMGALHVTAGMPKISPSSRAKRALEAAAHFSAGVAAPFNFVETPDT